jgi:hypothetical protein
MKKRSVSSMGALHPVLFFAGVYVVVLFFSIFICSALFYSCNTSDSKGYGASEKKPVELQASSSAIASAK